MPASPAVLEWMRQASGADAKGFYTAIGVGLFRINGDEAAVSCFVNPEAHSHDDKNASCSVNMLTGLWHCKGCGRSGNAYQAALGVGRSEQDALELAKRFGLFLETEREKPKLPGERDLKKWRKALLESEMLMDRLWAVKGWTPQAIARLGLGWDGERITFPIRTHKLERAGVVRYLPGGKPKSKAVPGTKRLLFPPPEVCSRKRPLFVVEGEGDAVSVWSCGHQAVAVPGTGSWRSDFALRLARFSCICLSDCDPQGRELAQRIARDVPNGARWVDLEPGRDDGYDIGDMVREAAHDGGLRQMNRILTAIANGG